MADQPDADDAKEAVQHLRRYLGKHVKFLQRYEVPLPKDLILSGIHEIINQHHVPHERHEVIWHEAIWDVNKDFEDIGIQGDLGATNAAVHVYVMV